MDPSREEIVSYLKERKPDYIEKFGLYKLGLFGSFARMDATETSDIDILIEFDNNPDILGTKLEIARDVKSVFHREADICREKCLKPQVKDEILREVLFV